MADCFRDLLYCTPMSQTAGSSGSSVQLPTFLSWKVSDVIGYKAKTKDGREYVVKVWCKSCAKYSDKTLRDPRLRGQARRDSKKFVSGTEFITKHTVTRHLSSLVHCRSTM